MTTLAGARSEQVVTATPSPPASISGQGESGGAVKEVVSTAQTAAVQQNIQAQARAPVSTEQVREAAKQIENFLKSIGRALEFRIDDDSGRTVITVRDSETGEVIRQIPGEESLRLAQTLGTQPHHALVDVAV